MLLLDPYKTSYGKIIHIDNIKKEIEYYYVANKAENLNYEFGSNNLCFIIGWSKEEKDLPVFNQPIILDANKYKFSIVACDLRKYVRLTQEQPLNIEDVQKDNGNVQNLTTSAMIIADLIDEEKYGIYRPVFKSVTTAYAFLISYLVNAVVTLNPVEQADVEMAAMFHANTLLIPDKIEKTQDYLDIIGTRMRNSKVSLPITPKGVEGILNKCVDYNSTITSLVNNIKYVLPPDKAELINESVLLSLLANMWYGPGANETVIMSLECMPLFISLLLSALGDNTYKRSRITTILDRHSKQIDSKEFVRQMENIIKENKRMM